MRVVYYNILDSMAFNSVGHCTWYTWMDLCNLLCDSIYVEVKIMQWIQVCTLPKTNGEYLCKLCNGKRIICKYGKSKILKGKKKYFYESRYTGDYRRDDVEFWMSIPE